MARNAKSGLYSPLILLLTDNENFPTHYPLNVSLSCLLAY